MRLLQTWAVILCVVVASSSASLADDKGDVAKAYASWNAAFNKHDAKAVAAAYLPDAKVLPPSHEVVSGRAEIEKFFAGLFASGFADHKLDIVDTGGDAEVIFGCAHWSANGKGPDGAPKEFSGLATHVFERQPDGSLKIRLHTFN